MDVLIKEKTITGKLFLLWDVAKFKIYSELVSKSKIVSDVK